MAAIYPIIFGKSGVMKTVITHCPYCDVLIIRDLGDKYEERIVCSCGKKITIYKDFPFSKKIEGE